MSRPVPGMMRPDPHRVTYTMLAGRERYPCRCDCADFVSMFHLVEMLKRSDDVSDIKIVQQPDTPEACDVTSGYFKN